MYQRIDILKYELSAVFSLSFTCLLCYLISVWVSPVNYSVEIIKYFSSDLPLDMFLPEPIEKMQYLVSLISFPVLLILFVLLFNLLMKSIKLSKIVGLQITYFIVQTTLGIGIILFLLLGIIKTNDLPIRNMLHKGILLLGNHIVIFMGIFVILILIVYLFWKLRNKLKIPSNQVMLVFANGITILFILFLALMNVYSDKIVDDNPIYTNHFNAIFHSVAAVVSNQIILIDFQSQYGLYPHFLEPVFRVIGLTVFSFTSIMAILLFTNFYLWYIFLKKNIVNKWFLYLGFLTTLYVSYLFLRADTFDSYFQYFPLRTIFPAILLVLVQLYFTKSKRKSIYYCLFFITSLSVLWNMETGIVVFVTWLAVLIFDELTLHGLTKVSILKTLRHLFVSFVILSVTFILYSIYIWFRAGVFPNYLESIQYIKYFYNYGFTMLPMPLFHPWNMIAFIYIIGIVLSVKAIFEKDSSIKVKLIFMLSILGCGLFSYYQGRSHYLNLYTVSYPALMLITLFSDQIYAVTKQRKIYFERIIFLCFMVLFMLLNTLTLAGKAHNFIQHFDQRWSTTLKNESNPVSNGVDFIKAHTNKGDKVLILSLNSGIYYAETKTKPALGLPGPSEMILKKDYQIMQEFINSEKMNQIFIDRNYSNGLIRTSLMKHYTVIESSSEGNIMLLSKNAK